MSEPLVKILEKLDVQLYAGLKLKLKAVDGTLKNVGHALAQSREIFSDSDHFSGYVQVMYASLVSLNRNTSIIASFAHGYDTTPRRDLKSSLFLSRIEGHKHRITELEKALRGDRVDMRAFVTPVDHVSGVKQIVAANNDVIVRRLEGAALVSVATSESAIFLKSYMKENMRPSREPDLRAAFERSARQVDDLIDIGVEEHRVLDRFVRNIRLFNPT